MEHELKKLLSAVYFIHFLYNNSKNVINNVPAALVTFIIRNSHLKSVTLAAKLTKLKVKLKIMKIK